MNFRKLKADEIDVRVAMVKENGCSLLLYKDARVDQNLLDETFGSFGWKRTHELIGDRLYCTVSVKDPESGEWVSKQDVGTESKTEKEKGQASDSFKRACFNWGIGRELYTAPFIWISPEDANIKNGKVGESFKVGSIGYDTAGNIAYLTIIGTRGGKVVYTFGKDPDKEPIGEAKAKELAKTLKKEKVELDTVYKLYKVEELKDLTAKKYANILENLDNLREKQ